MTWHDFVAEKELVGEDVAVGVARMFGLDAHQVVVSDDIAQVQPAPVVCVTRGVHGDFRTVVEVYVTDERLAQFPVPETVAAFAKALGCACLVSDDSPNPYSWILVNAAGKARAVMLDAEELDDHERYVLRR